MLASTQPQSTFDSAAPGPFPFEARWFRYCLLGLVGAVPLLLDALHRGDLIYLNAAVVHALAAGFSLLASRRFPSERMRWQVVGIATAIHALCYVSAFLGGLGWMPALGGAWVGNLSNALWMVLLIPALMGKRSDHGDPVRTMDVALAALATLMLMAALGSGTDPGNGFVRVWTGIAGMAVLAVLAFTLHFADARPELRRFTHVMTCFLLLEVLDTVLINVLLPTYLPQTPDVIVDFLIPLPELLLCDWVLRPGAPQPLRRFHLDRSIVDSLQPSVLTLVGVALALYAFRHHAVLAAVAVLAVVLCYAMRTQMYYALLFRERSLLLLRATEYQHLATRDPLTGIGNRRWFEANLQAAFSNPDAFPCTLLLVDTDHFKQVNDTYGHDAGDAVLCVIAETLEREAGPTRQACIARIGGDEFAVLLRNMENSEAMAVAERVRTSVVQFSAKRGYPVTVSIGATTVHGPVPRKDMLRSADAALYRAKNAGRNAVCGRA